MKKILKRQMKKVDNFFFDGRIRKCYRKIRKKPMNNYSYPIFDEKGEAVLEIALSDLLMMQTDRYDRNKGCQWDLAVRYLAILNFFGKNEDGFCLYKKMHLKRGNYGEFSETEERHSEKQFESLIKSYLKNGYDSTSYITVDRNMLLKDGSHRSALAVYHDQEFVSVCMKDFEFHRRAYTRDWFWENGFSREECIRIEDIISNIERKCKEDIGEFYCVLYPPAKKYFDDIVEELREYDRNNIFVTGFQDYCMNKKDFLGFVRCLYFFDNITNEDFERKMSYIFQACEEETERYHLRIVTLDVRDINYIVKRENGQPESRTMMDLKQVFRKRYKAKDERFRKKYVEGYAHDVIMHSTDNYISNKACRHLLGIKKDVSELLKRWGERKYVIIENSPDMLHPEFPNNFYIDQDLDIDIFVSATDLEDFIRITYQFCQETYVGDWINVCMEEANFGKHVAVYLKNCLIVEFDFMTHFYALKNSFIDECLNHPTEKRYKCISSKQELLIRIAKCLRAEERDAPRKYHHESYILKHLGQWDKRLAQTAFENYEEAYRFVRKITTEKGILWE